MNDYIGKIISGKELKSKFPNLKFFKFDEFLEEKISDGLNVDAIVPFNPERKGGLFFLDQIETIRKCDHYRKQYLRKVIIPDYAQVYVKHEHIFKCDLFILKEKEDFTIKDFIKIHITNEEFQANYKWLEIKDVPENMLTIEICQYMITYNYFIKEILKYVPIEMRTRKICEIAISRDCLSLDFVPKEHIDYDMYMCCLRYFWHGIILKKIPMEFRDYSLCLRAVGSYGHALEHVPEHLIDYKMCEVAISPKWERNDACAYRFVPEKFKTYELSYKAICMDGRNLKYVPMEFRDKKICNAVLTGYYSDRGQIINVPDDLKKDEDFMKKIKEKWDYDDLMSRYDSDYDDYD